MEKLGKQREVDTGCYEGPMDYLGSEVVGGHF